MVHKDKKKLVTFPCQIVGKGFSSWKKSVDMSADRCQENKIFVHGSDNANYFFSLLIYMLQGRNPKACCKYPLVYF